MGLEAEVGDVKYYHEMGEVYKVEVVDVQEELFNEGRDKGEKYTLKVLELCRINSMFKDETHAEIGEEFEVSKINNAGGYSGWFLLDHD